MMKTNFPSATVINFERICLGAFSQQRTKNFGLQLPDRATIILLIYKQIKRSVEPLQLLKWKKQGCPIRDSLHIIPLSGASPILLEIHSLKRKHMNCNISSIS